MNQGFTLIELLVVVLIIGVLSAIALPQYQTAVERSRATEALTQMNAVRTALERYHAQHEEFPTANAFNKLDVEIPLISAGSYGGKNFTITFTNAGKITATRRRDSHAYVLTTEITEQSNGTYTAVRKCAPVNNSDEEATAYCNAITGGNNDNF